MENWMNHPEFQNMDAAKIELIKTVVEKTAGKKQKELAPVMMNLITGAKKKNIRFSADEFTLIMGIFKEGKSEQECAQLDKTVNMIRGMMEKNGGKK